MLTDLRIALLRPLAFFRTIGHAPTAAEWLAACEKRPSLIEREVAVQAMEELVASGDVFRRFGRMVFPSDGEAFVQRQREQEIWMPRKLRTARRVAKWLSRLSSVRFVALCNTTALGHARDGGDLDFFVITKRGTIMQSRAFAALPFKLFGRRPGEGDERDAVCLSYFVTDNGLDLSSHMLTPDDPYFRHWFLSLLPLYDDGVSLDLWKANQAITHRHPFAQPWIVPPDFKVETPRLRLPAMSLLERLTTTVQTKAFPSTIRDQMNRDSRVIVTERALKFHVEDGREEYRMKYEEFCRTLV